MQLHDVVNLWKGQESEELQVPMGQNTLLVYTTHLIFVSNSLSLQKTSCLLLNLHIFLRFIYFRESECMHEHEKGERDKESQADSPLKTV